MQQAILSGVLFGGLYALLSLGFALKLRIADTVNLAYGGFVVLGMYATLVLSNDWGVPVYLAVMASGALVAAFSYVVHVVMIGGPGKSGHREQIIYTLILLSVIELLLEWHFGSALQSLKMRPTPVSIGDAVVSRAQLIAGVVAILLGMALFVMFKYTPLGKTIEVAGTYPDGAKAIGIPVERIYRGVFVLGGTLAGVTGGLAMTFYPVSPFLGLEFVLVALLISISARLSFWGCLAAGLVYGAIQSVMQRETGPDLAQVYIFAVFLVVLASEELFAWLRAAMRFRKISPMRSPA